MLIDELNEALKDRNIQITVVPESEFNTNEFIIKDDDKYNIIIVDDEKYKDCTPEDFIKMIDDIENVVNDNSFTMGRDVLVTCKSRESVFGRAMVELADKMFYKAMPELTDRPAWQSSYGPPSRKKY